MGDNGAVSGDLIVTWYDDRPSIVANLLRDRTVRTTPGPPRSSMGW